MKEDPLLTMARRNYARIEEELDSLLNNEEQADIDLPNFTASYLLSMAYGYVVVYGDEELAAWIKGFLRKKNVVDINTVSGKEVDMSLLKKPPVDRFNHPEAVFYGDEEYDIGWNSCLNYLIGQGYSLIRKESIEKYEEV